MSNAGWEICSKPMECVLGLLYFETGIFFVVLYCWGALQFVFVLLFIVQLLHKLSIHADDGPMKLMKASFTEYQQFRLTVLLFFSPTLLLQVIKNPIIDHLPTGCPKIGTSYHSEQIVDVSKLAKDEPVVFVIGAMAHGKVIVVISQH